MIREWLGRVKLFNIFIHENDFLGFYEYIIQNYNLTSSLVQTFYMPT